MTYVLHGTRFAVGSFTSNAPSPNTFFWLNSSLIHISQYVSFWRSIPTIRGLVGDSTLVIDYPFSQRRPIRRHRVPTRGDTCLWWTCVSVGQNVTVKYSFRAWRGSISFKLAPQRTWRIDPRTDVLGVFHAEHMFARIVSRYLQRVRHDWFDPPRNIYSRSSGTIAVHHNDIILNN